PDQPQVATVLDGLAGLYGDMDNPTKALPLYERALKIREKALGPKHPLTANALRNLALNNVSLGDTKEALRLAVQTRQIELKNLSDILSFTSEQQRLAF